MRALQAHVCRGLSPFHLAMGGLFGAQEIFMPYRLKKFSGMLILVALVVLYAMIATTIATYRLAESAWYVHLAFFAFSGVLWVVPAMFVISWMERKPKGADEAASADPFS
jgi:hypothetical protein